MPVTEDNEHRPVYNIHKAENCLILINASFGTESRLQKGNTFKTIDKSKNSARGCIRQIKGLYGKDHSRQQWKYNNISTYKKADNEEIRMRGKDL